MSCSVSIQMFQVGIMELANSRTNKILFPLDQQSGNATAEANSKTRTRNFWFWFDCAMKFMNKFSTPNQIYVFLAGFQSSPEVLILGSDQKDRGIGDEIGINKICLFLEIF